MKCHVRENGSGNYGITGVLRCLQRYDKAVLCYLRLLEVKKF
jgi:glycerol-3-phosphate acyltransferase PlsY